MFERIAPWLVGIVLLAGLGAAMADERPLAVDEDELVEVEIATVAIATNGSPVVLLREPLANEVVPIFIGPAEAAAISRALSGEEMPRPMTHDLLRDLVGALAAEVRRVIVDDLRNSTFHGAIELDVAGRDDVLRLDSRPSDALALAGRTGAAIHVAPKVLEVARDIEYEGLDDHVVTAVGITVNPVTDDLREAMGLPDEPGVLVSEATGPAREAGMVPGAVITGVNDGTPENPMDFLELVRTTPEDDKVRLTFWQEGETRTIEVPTDVPEPRSPRRDDDPGIAL